MTYCGDRIQKMKNRRWYKRGHLEELDSSHLIK